MITAERRGRFRGVWRLVDHSRNAVSIKLWFDEARARRAAHRQQAQRQQQTLWPSH